MTHHRRRKTSWIAAAAFLSCVGLAHAQGSLTAEQERGRAVYRSKGCYQCHGLAGQGSVLTGPSLSPLRQTDDAVRAYVRRPSGIMPGYSVAILADVELKAVTAYLRSIPPAKPPSQIALLAGRGAQATAPALPDARGRMLYVNNCAACHGEAREGGLAPALRTESRKRTYAQTVMFILDPPPAMPKLSPGALSDAEVRLIAAYVRADN